MTVTNHSSHAGQTPYVPYPDLDKQNTISLLSFRELITEYSDKGLPYVVLSVANIGNGIIGPNGKEGTSYQHYEANSLRKWINPQRGQKWINPQSGQKDIKDPNSNSKIKSLSYLQIFTSYFKSSGREVKLTIPEASQVPEVQMVNKDLTQDLEDGIISQVFFERVVDLLRDASQLSADNYEISERFHQMGNDLYKGTSQCDPDVDHAKHWYLASAKRNNPESQYALGLLAAKGKHVVRNPSLAKHWLRLAAGNGHTEAKMTLAK